MTHSYPDRGQQFAPGATIPPPATEVPPPPPVPNGNGTHAHVDMGPASLFRQDLERQARELGVDAAREGAGLPKASPMTLQGVAALYGVPLSMLISAAAHDVGAPATQELAAITDGLHDDAVAKVNAGARLVYAMYHAGKAWHLDDSFPEPVRRAYMAACDVFEVRPDLPGAGRG